MSATLVEGRTAQRWGHVFRAEICRALRRGAMRSGVIIIFVVSVTCAMTTLLILEHLPNTHTRLLVTLPIEAGGFVATMFLSIGVIFQLGRDHAGHMSIALTLVPCRSRLYLARAVAFFTIGALTVAAVTGVTALAGVIVTGAAANWAVLGIVLMVLAGGWLALLAFAIGSWIRHAGLALLIVIGLLVILPLGVGAAGSLLPHTFASIAQVALDATPSLQLARGTGVSTIPSQGILPVIVGQCGLSAWAIGITYIGGAIFAKRDV